MQVRLYQVDAFTDRVFGGNPAAVCPLERWLDDATLQAIALENNLSETAFFVPKDDGTYHLRWFTPRMEIDLAGHPTLATAFVIFEKIAPKADVLRFDTSGGRLEVRRDGDLVVMDFPARPPKPCAMPAAIAESLGRAPVEFMRSRDFFAVLGSEAELAALKPRMDPLMELDALGLIVTAPGGKSDFVSRFFVPSAGIPEDPVTGSAHCTLIPYWAERLGKTKLHAFQISDRRGELFCEHRGERVTIAGRVAWYMEGTLLL